MGYAGLGFVILDMEHGPIGFETLRGHILAAEKSGLVPIVRVPGYDSDAIGKSLDLGAYGVQVPSVGSAEEASHVIREARFHPEGERGVCRFVRAADYGTADRNEYFSRANECLVVLQIEGKEGLANFDEIVSVAGIDIIFIGPYDLSRSLGVPGDIENPIVVGEIEKLVSKAKEQNIVLGTFCDTVDQVVHWRDLGIAYLAYSVDINIFVQGIESVLNGVDGR